MFGNMKTNGKQTIFIHMAIAGSLLFSGATMLAVQMQQQAAEQVIRFGMFAGSYWDVPTGNCYEVVDSAIERFEESHPGVKIEYVSGILKEDYPEWLAEQVVLGKEPDVFMIPAGSFDELVSLHVLQELDGLIEADPAFSCEDYYEGAYSYGEIRGFQYALPYETVPTLMFVNKTLLAKEAIAIPDGTWTWDDFLDICRRVTKDTDGDGVTDQYGCYDYGWQEAVRSNGAVLFEEDGKTACFSDRKVEEAVRFVKELNAVNEGYLVTAREFDRGKVAFRPFSFSEYRTYKPYPWRIKKYSDFEWDCVKLPVGPEGKGESELDTLLMGISSRSRQTRLAWEFLKELCYSEETQTQILERSQGMPVVRGAATLENLHQALGDDTPGSSRMNAAVLSQVMEEAVAAPNFQKYPAAMELADGEIVGMVQGDVSMDNGLLKLQREINSMLRK